MKGCYIGFFATDPKPTAKDLKSYCKDSLLAVVEDDENNKEALNDLANFEQFSAPKDNYHATCLYYAGKKLDQLKPKQKLILKDFKKNEKVELTINFAVYVPGYIFVGPCLNETQDKCDNKNMHVTLLLKNGAKAVDSNEILENLFNAYPDLLNKELDFKVKSFEVAYKDQKLMYVINKSTSFAAISGDDISFGKK